MQYEHGSGHVERYVSVFRTVFEKLFVNKNQKINAAVILSTLKQEEINVHKLKQFFDILPKDEWSLKTFFDHINELNEIFKISDEYIQDHAVTKVSASDIKDIRWEILLESMLEYSRFTTEFYDVLKYNKSILSYARLRLLNELMLVFMFVKEDSKKIYDRYKNQKFSNQVLLKFNQDRLGIEFLMLRILYVLLHLDKANDETINHYAELIGKERISLLYSKIPIPVYS